MKNVATVLIALIGCFVVAVGQTQQRDAVAGPVPDDSTGRLAPFGRRPRAQRPPQPGLFRSLDSAQKNTDSVQILVLRDMGLTSLPKEIARMKNLRSIDLSGNKLSSFPVELLQIPTITIIDLSNNPIKAVPPEISKLSQLVRLNLKNTGITTVPSTIGSCKGLMMLDVSRNPLTSLPIKELNSLPQLKSIPLGNPDVSADEK